MSRIPGDFGDNRLIAYFLENIYQVIIGRSPSLWHLPFFAPHPYIGGLSDNLFGSAPIYLFMRLLSDDPLTAFQLWYFFGYAANYAAAYYALRRLGLSGLAAATGALVFTFAMPLSGQVIHLQLYYRFGVPLAIMYWILLLQQKQPRLLILAAIWLVWQFYCSIYIGFFTILLLGIITILHLIQTEGEDGAGIKGLAAGLLLHWQAEAGRAKLVMALAFAALAGLMILLLYPYMHAQTIYQVKRSLREVETMLPRFQSYFLADHSDIWGALSAGFGKAVPMRHEHQIFMGLLPLGLGLMAVLCGSRARNGMVFPLMAGVIGVSILLTLNAGGMSMWYIFAQLPLASTFRAMARIWLVLLFPLGFLVGLAIDMLLQKGEFFSRLARILLIPALMMEYSAVTLESKKKQDWQERTSRLSLAVPDRLAPDAILFFAQKTPIDVDNIGRSLDEEVDAMWAGLQKGVPVLNGYTGYIIPGYTIQYGLQCQEVPKRVLATLKLRGKEGDVEAYRALMRRIVPIGFEGCQPEWLQHPPQ